MRKIKVLTIFTNTNGGVGFYRSYQPHDMLQKMYPDEFEVKVITKPNFSDYHKFDEFDIVHFHKGVYFKNPMEQQVFTNLLKYLKERGTVTIMDIDDYWKLPTYHPQRIIREKERQNKNTVNTEEMIKYNLSSVDYVTTTTTFFAKAIKPFNKNVYIFPNAINPDDERFQIDRKPCNKIRFGFVMGSTHEKDLDSMDNFVAKLSKDVLDKIEIVLCGFDTVGQSVILNPDGTTTKKNMTPTQTVWYRYEKMLTNNYKNVSPEYKEYLHRFDSKNEYPDAEKDGYKRCWTKDMDHYFQHYSEIDVLLAPLDENDFNLVKSELKPVECCFSHTAFIGSNFGPYTIGLKNLFKKGGEIDPDGNAILIDRNRAHKDWVKAIEKLVKHPEYVKILQDNLYRDFHEKYDLRNVTVKRAEFYREITKDRIK